MVKFAYNNIKNTNTGQTFFKIKIADFNLMSFLRIILILAEGFA